MSPGWEMWCGGYVITPAYLLLDSLWLLRGRISCSSSPHVRSIVQPWFTVFNPSAGWKRWTVLIHCCSLATTSSSLTHTQPLPISLSLFLTTSFKALSLFTKPLLHTNPCSHPLCTLPPFLPCSPYSCSELWAMSVASLWHCTHRPGGAATVSYSSPAIGCQAE